MRKGSLRTSNNTSSGDENLRLSCNLLLRDDWLSTWLLDHGLAESLSARLGSIVSHGSLSIVVELGSTTIKALLEKHQDVLDEMKRLGSLQEGGVNVDWSALLTEVHEVSLVLHVNLLSLADLGQLVVGNEKLLLTNSRAMEASSSLDSAIRLLEANEGAG